MSTGEGGGKTTTDGLEFYLDAGNAKSFRGEPTINLAANGGLIGMSGISLTYLGLDGAWKKYSMSGTFSGYYQNGTYPYILKVTAVAFTGGVAYSSKCTIRTNVLYKFNYFGTVGINYVNEPTTSGGVPSSITNSDGSKTVARAGFIYTATTTQHGYLYTNPINNTTFDPNTDFVWIKDLQIEQKPYSTPYVNGTRGATVETGGGWGDLSKKDNNGEFVNGPIFNFANRGSIVFDGIDDYINIPTSPIVNGSYNNWTIDVWMKPGDQVSRFITPSSNGVDQFLAYDNTNQRVNVQITESGDVNNRLRAGTTGSVPIGVWSMVTVSINNLNIKIYVNGLLTNSYTETISIGSWVGFWRLGQRINNTFWYLGEIAMVKTYSRELTSTEVLKNYTATKSRFL